MALRRLDPAVKHRSGLTPFTKSHRIGLANVKFGQEFRNSNIGLTSGAGTRPPRVSDIPEIRPCGDGGRVGALQKGKRNNSAGTEAVPTSDFSRVSAVKNHKLDYQLDRFRE
ncbi:hypothetical protein PGTUg99_018606 [Puccinia graminis f. sp. tritici]|uniref:Uncharacterized protein n=1 Tax=Puccinia graminis f. sp. tritici TaxID=56615 RepID=A0A5B0S5R8_PUCGR|nr:hypothetical protein PGTUg99_018606 [Puccinia graminis f. sp. tritici]